MMKSKDWYENNLSEFKGDPEYLKEYISLLNDELDFIREQNLDLIKMYKELRFKISDRFRHIINGKGPIIPRIAIKIAVDDILSFSDLKIDNDG